MTNTELSGGDAVLRVKALEQQIAALEAEKVGRQQAVPSGWVPLLIEYDPGYPEEVAFGPQRMMDRLKIWLDKYFAMRSAAPAAIELSGIGRDAGHPRAVVLYLRHDPSDEDLRTIQEMFRAAPAPAERVEQEAAVLAVQPAMNWRNCYHRASMDLCAIGELLGVPEEDQCTPEIIEAIKALQQSNPPEQVEPVAWMHDSPGRVDVISAEVKKLLVDSHDTAGHLHRPLDKSEHYTIPLYTAPAMKEHEEMKNAMQLAQGPKPTTLGQLHDYLDSIRKAWSAQDTKYLGSYESQPLYILPNDPTPGFQLAEAKYFAEFGLTFIPFEGASK
ncbi:MAG: hypothetical protein CMK78_11370 [Pseudomonadales bacterium]|nr:hypothetical protein [Pseudomonadales bacterium]